MFEDGAEGGGWRKARHTGCPGAVGGVQTWTSIQDRASRAGQQPRTVRGRASLPCTPDHGATGGGALHGALALQGRARPWRVNPVRGHSNAGKELHVSIESSHSVTAFVSYRIVVFSVLLSRRAAGCVTRKRRKPERPRSRPGGQGQRQAGTAGAGRAGRVAEGRAHRRASGPPRSFIPNRVKNTA